MGLKNWVKLYTEVYNRLNYSCFQGVVGYGSVIGDFFRCTEIEIKAVHNFFHLMQSLRETFAKLENEVNYF